MKITFDENFPDLLRQEVENILTEFSWLLPQRWMQRIYVNYDANEKEFACYTNTDKDYRFGTLTICAHWLRLDAGERIEVLIHELIHYSYSPAKNYALDITDKLCGDNRTMFEIIRSELNAKNEQGTQDIAWAVFNKFYEN